MKKEGRTGMDVLLRLSENIIGSPSELLADGSLARIFAGTSIGLCENGRIVYANEK